MAFNNNNTNYATSIQTNTQDADVNNNENKKSGNNNNKRHKMSDDDNSTAKTLPKWITPEQRASKLKRLETENEILRQRLTNMEKLMEHMNTKNIEEQALKNNRFGAIIDDDAENTVMDTTVNTVDDAFELAKKAIKRKNTTTINNNETQPQQNAMKKNNKPEQTYTAKTNGERKTSKPPPLHIHKQNIKDTLQLVKGAGVKDFEIRRVNNEKHSLISKNMDEYEKIKTVFKEVNTNYFTYTPKELKPKVIVLKGLNEDEDIAELKATIETHDNIKVLNVTQMKTKRSTEKNFKLPLYLIYFTPDTDLSQIYKIKVLNYQIVTWENLRKRNEITQCRKCQRFGHSASNCNLEYRCVKCNEHHDPGECKTKERTENENIFCVNCNQMGHPASFKGCTIYQNALQRLKLKIKDKQQQKLPKTFQSITVNTENGSYADMLRQNNSEQTTVHKLAMKVEKMAQIIQEQSEQIAQLLNMLAKL